MFGLFGQVLIAPAHVCVFLKMSSRCFDGWTCAALTAASCYNFQNACDCLYVCVRECQSTKRLMDITMCFLFYRKVCMCVCVCLHVQPLTRAVGHAETCFVLNRDIFGLLLLRDRELLNFLFKTKIYFYSSGLGYWIVCLAADFHLSIHSVELCIKCFCSRCWQWKKRPGGFMETPAGK